MTPSKTPPPFGAGQEMAILFGSLSYSGEQRFLEQSILNTSLSLLSKSVWVEFLGISSVWIMRYGSPSFVRADVIFISVSPLPSEVL